MAANDLLGDITEKSTKADMLKKLNELADMVRSHEKKRTGRLGEIEKRVREKYKPGDVPELHNAIVSATVEEWQTMVDFLGEFEDILPAALARIRQGGTLLLGPKAEEEGK